MTVRKIRIGIDTGTETGFAVWSITENKLFRVESMMIHQAMFCVLTYLRDPETIIDIVRVEDARQAVFGRNLEGFKAQGAGSVKRDAKIWEDFLVDYKIPFQMVRPSRLITKWKSDLFKKAFQWEGRTNSHSRDAAMLVGEANTKQYAH